ncbi:hypothetical protein BDQ12DRAFT_159634 [Crucibulum laeve]|uniref:F-box domain-containing protein n=1 Tax=Crucibulum laeve TaxID=68775 RepID=A0A5C3LWA0_9AGAR|nr:hypothetical protein BDQ12DRAFT_159634 [Crucibulum laeve]
MLFDHDDFCLCDLICKCFFRELTERTHQSRTVFPYNLAYVCQQWRTILSVTPEYWTKLVIFVGPNATPLDDIRSFLEWSKGLSLEVFVTRDFSSSITSDPAEPERAWTVFDILLPHFPCFTTFSFNVIHSSSLPSVMHLPLSMRDKDMTSINVFLMCAVDDGPMIAMDLPPTRASQNSEVMDFHLDGRNALSMTLNFASTLECWGSFTMSHYTPLSFETPISILDILQILCSLRGLCTLKLIDLHPVLGASYQYSLSIYSLYIEGIAFEDIAFEIIERFFILCHMEKLEVIKITRCPLDGPIEIPFTAETLILENIDSTLVSFLSDWDGTMLYVKNCTQFNDDVFALFNQFDEDGVLWPTHLRSITIEGCPNFTISALKNMVQTRVDSNGGGEPFTPDSRRVHDITLVNCEQTITPEDEAWFSANISKFYCR